MAVARLLPRPSLRHSAKAKAPARTQVIALANQKGGVAKTTTTLNLGVASAPRRGMRVLCIDLDPQGNLTMSQGMNPDTIERSMFDVLVHRMPIAEVIAQREIDIAVASIDLAGADMALSSQIGRERALQKALDADQGQLRLHPDRHAAVARPADDQRVRRRDRRDRAGADRVPVAARSRPAREHAADGARQPEPERRRSSGSSRRCTTSRVTHSREADEILRENFGELVYNTRIRKTIRYAEAPVKGSSIMAYEPDGEAAALYRDLAKEVLNGEKAR